MPAPPPDVQAYLDAQPPAHRKALLALRKRILAMLPGATERISYQMPAFVYQGKVVAWMAGFTKHCSFFPPTRRFTLDEPIPDAELRRLIRAFAKAKGVDVPARKASVKRSTKKAAEKAGPKAARTKR